MIATTVASYFSCYLTERKGMNKKRRILGEEKITKHSIT